MRFLRSPRGGSGEPPGPLDRAPDGGPGPASAEAAEAGGMVPREAAEAPTDEARAAELMQEFEAGLSDLARRQVRYAGYAWEPPVQLDRRGRWIATEATEGSGHDGRRVSMRAGEGLELDESGEERPDRTSWRFVRAKDGRTVDLPAGPDGSWPEGLERPRSGGEG